MNKKEALTQLEIMATNATGRLGEAKSEEEKALLSKEIEALDMAMDALKDYTPKTGHWIGTEYDGYADGYPVYDVYECSECGMEYDATDDGEITHNYCPNCGAKMERSKDVY